MSADNNYNEILEEVCEKLNNLDTTKNIDILDIKNSIESIENMISDNQSKLNFQDIKEKLETIAFQVDSCNEALLKDLYNDLNQIKETSASIGTHLENIQNVQNLSLTSAEFEEFQKQQLDLALKTNENIFNELTKIKENASSSDSSEKIKNLEAQLTNLHNFLLTYFEQLTNKLKSIEEAEHGASVEQVGSIMSDLNSVNQKSIKQTNALIKELKVKLENIENVEFKNQLAKMSEIYDSLSIINAWIDKVGLLNKSIENVYARFGENIDFDDVSEKIDIIYENISALSRWTQKIDNVDGSIADMVAKIASLKDCLENTKNINNTISGIKERLDITLTDEVNFEDLTNKMDIVYESLTSLNEWAVKVDSINEKISNIGEVSISEGISEDIKNIAEKVDTISEAFEDELVASKIDLIYENIGLLNEWVQKVDGLATTNDSINSKIEEITESIVNTNKIIEEVPNIKDKLEDISVELGLITRTTKNDADSYIYTLLDIESDFLRLHKFLDDKTNKTTDDINTLKERFEELNDDISSISKRTNKLILSADDANKEFKTYLDMFKTIIYDLDIQRKTFNPEPKLILINNNLSNIVQLLQNSLIANKNLNSAFMYLAEWVDAAGGTLNSIVDNADSSKENILAEVQSLKTSITEVLERVNEIEVTSNIPKKGVTFEATNNITFVNEKIDQLISSSDSRFNSVENSLQEKIDSYSQKIEKLISENDNKYTELESALQDKVLLQSNKIDLLEEKIEMLSSKFDKLIDAMSEEHKNYDIKDSVSVLSNQITTMNDEVARQKLEGQELGRLIREMAVKIDEETTITEIRNGLALVSNQIYETTKIMQNQPNTDAVVKEVAEKLSSFDANINKLVSYIEED